MSLEPTSLIESLVALVATERSFPATSASGSGSGGCSGFWRSNFVNDHEVRLESEAVVVQFAADAALVLVPALRIFGWFGFHLDTGNL